MGRGFCHLYTRKQRKTCYIIIQLYIVAACKSIEILLNWKKEMQGVCFIYSVRNEQWKSSNNYDKRILRNGSQFVSTSPAKSMMGLSSQCSGDGVYHKIAITKGCSLLTDPQTIMPKTSIQVANASQLRVRDNRGIYPVTVKFWGDGKNCSMQSYWSERTNVAKLWEIMRN